MTLILPFWPFRRRKAPEPPPVVARPDRRPTLSANDLARLVGQAGGTVVLRCSKPSLIPSPLRSPSK